MPQLKKRSLEDLEGAELGAVLAGLRLLQESVGKYGAAPSSSIQMIYTNMGKYQGLSSQEIDTLCRRLNSA